MNAPVEFVSSYVPSRPLALLFAREETQEGQWPKSGERKAKPDPDHVMHWDEVHARLVRFGVDKARHEREVCRWLLAAERLGVHLRAGYASLREYADRTLGLKGRQTEERLRVGRALRDLPLLDAALSAGELHWSAVRELTRVATAETQGDWVAWSKGRGIREVERAVAGHNPGERPDQRPDPSLVKHRLSFEVRAETMALFRDAQSRLRQEMGTEMGGELDDDALLLEMARRALGGSGDEGRAGYQVAVVRCDACKQASIDAGGERHAIDDAVAEMAECDGQHLGHLEVSAPSRQVVSPHVGAETPTPVATRTNPEPPLRLGRAKQRIPPAVRRLVMRRDGGRCRVPGCHNHVFVDAHHCDPLSEGGNHNPERILCLCGAHHRAVHQGRLCIDGSASTRFRFRHADGTLYGGALRPPSLDVAQQVFGALTSMGFKHTEARALVDAVTHSGPPADASEFLRAALRGA